MAKWSPRQTRVRAESPLLPKLSRRTLTIAEAEPVVTLSVDYRFVLRSGGFGFMLKTILFIRRRTSFATILDRNRFRALKFLPKLTRINDVCSLNPCQVYNRCNAAELEPVDTRMDQEQSRDSSRLVPKNAVATGQPCMAKSQDAGRLFGAKTLNSSRTTVPRNLLQFRPTQGRSQLNNLPNARPSRLLHTFESQSGKNKKVQHYPRPRA